jgi:integrase
MKIERQRKRKKKKKAGKRNLELREGVWWLRCQNEGTRYHLSTGCTDYKSAVRRADKMKDQIRDGNFGWRRTPCPTFAGWGKTYWKTYSKKKASASRDRQILAHAVEYFGQRPLDAITQSECLAYLIFRATQPNQYKRLPKQGTLTREHSLLSAVFNRAIQEGLISKNPWKGIKRVPYEAKDRVLSHDEQTKLMAVLNPEHQRMVVVGLGTGLRVDGLLGFAPNDVDTVNEVIHLPARLAKGGKARDIPLVPEVVTALRAQAAAKAIAGSQPFFRKNESGVRTALARACKRAKIPHFTPHDLRRTFGTRCALAAVPPVVLQKIMGHASLEITMKFYVHVQQRNLVAAMANVNLGLNDGATTPPVPKTVPVPPRTLQLAVNE